MKYTLEGWLERFRMELEPSQMSYLRKENKNVPSNPKIFTKKLDIHKIFFFLPGIYVCNKCNHELFSAKAKFKHDSPWPAFQETLKEDSIVKEIETLPQSSSNAKCFKVRAAHLLIRGCNQFFYLTSNC